jgi:hypothetical protein
LLPLTAFPQETGILSIVLRDQNNDLITVGIVSITDEQGSKTKTIELSEQKTSLTMNLDFGSYILEVQSPGFKIYQKKIEISQTNNRIEIQLEIEEVKVDIKVEKSERERRIDEAFSGFLTERDIASLPENGEHIREELQRRYGDDILIRIDGDFEGSQIPSRDQIASIKVIRNTFDAEFHEIASLIIDIRTKVTANGFHGFINFSLSDSIFNARNPFYTSRQPGTRQ